MAQLHFSKKSACLWIMRSFCTQCLYSCIVIADLYCDFICINTISIGCFFISKDTRIPKMQKNRFYNNKYILGMVNYNLNSLKMPILTYRCTLTISYVYLCLFKGLQSIMIMFPFAFLKICLVSQLPIDRCLWLIRDNPIF